jgi:predicted helicase/very-short-patch-repair endonuclease
MGLRAAFQYLLSGTARTAGWTLIPEETLPGKRVRPDGTFKDQYSIPRGWWESKDEEDDLEKEIQIKIGRGYPTANTIFEDSRRAILFQNKRKAGEFDLANAAELAGLLTAFYSFTPPDIRSFEQAVEQFSKDIPLHAAGLLEKIEEGYHDNKKFRAAFDGFFTLCQQSLNPNIRVEAVKEMLVQHLLTERLIRTIFNNPEFTRRNVIAAEVEKVIDALVSPYFNREEFLATLDRFYKAIEEAARAIESFSDKQHFLNSVYERFFQGYSVKVADTHGIVYTPQPIVDFMCASVEEVLKSEFGKTLGSPDVYVIDPCTGTGNFVVNLLNRVPAKDLERVYREQFFANEVMLMPYYIAALNIEHAYYERTGKYEPFEGLCFVDTLDLAEAKQKQLGFMSERNLERVERQRKTPITVVIGNPPYNTNQLDENDNNKNRAYPVIDKEIQKTYTRDSAATNRNKLGDAYVRFYRWATDRLGERPGVVCFVSNNGFLRGIAFDGFRKHLTQDFDLIYHFDFKGNARTSGERRRQEGGNIFHDLIRVGVGITVLVRTKGRKKKGVRYHVVDDYLKWEDKDAYLRSFDSVSSVPWQTLTPDKHNNWLAAENVEEFEQFIPLGTKEAKSGRIAPPIPPVNGGESELGLPTLAGGQKGGSGTSWSEVAPETWDRAQRLRRALTPAEKKLWKALRAKQLGLNFRRQHPIGRYVADFYSPQARLVVEVDGDSHAEPDQIRHDEERTRFMETHGLHVKRYSNRQINESLDGVLQEIVDTIRQAPPNPPVNGGEAESGLPTLAGGQRGAGTVFKAYSLGVNTNRDEWVYGWDSDDLSRNVQKLIDTYNSDLDRWKRSGRPKDVDSFVTSDGNRIKWSSRLKETFVREVYARFDKRSIRTSLFRPFDREFLFFDHILNHRQGVFPRIFPLLSSEAENLVICVSTISTTQPFHCLITNVLADLHLTGDTQCFPFYVYHEDGSGRRENVTDWAVEEFRKRYEGGGMRDERKKRKTAEKTPLTSPRERGEIQKWDIFYYVYGILHHPGYREKFGDNLKRELPRIPFAPDFWAFSEAGRKLAELHLKYEELKPVWEETPPRPPAKAGGKGKASARKETPLSSPRERGEIKLVIDPKAKTRDLYRVEKMRLSKDKAELKVNDCITVTGIPPEVYEYRLGNRSALEWAIDQYQIKTDKRSGITHDPNREDDPQYILRLVGQVIRVSLETVKIVHDLPVAFSQSFSFHGPQER